MQQPDIVTPHRLFETSARYKAPIFQRFYIWGRKEFENLVEDLDNSSAEGIQFLGAIVLKDLGKTKGPTSPANLLMIDGQQRLTTLYLVFLALASLARTHGDKATATFIERNYLVESKSPTFSGWPKLVPTLQDRHSLWELLETHAPSIKWDFSADPREKKGVPSAPLTAQWKRISEFYLTQLVDDNKKLIKQEFNRVLQSIQEYLHFICITLDDADDANGIFSRLNAEGVPLGLADLVRNEVFSKFADASKAEAFYVKHWHPFERSFPEKTLNVFFPIYAYMVFQGRVTKTNAFARLQSKWKKETPETILLDLRRYSPYFTSLVKFAPHNNLSKEVNGQVHRLSRMPRTTVTWPFVIETLRAAAENKIKIKEALQSLRIVESFLVRRALIGIEPTGLHSVFKSLWEKTKGKPKAVLQKIVTRTIQCPTDKELRATLATEPSDSRVILKYVLEEYERAFVEANKYDPVPATAITIEHVLPQHLSKDWQKVFSASQHRKLNGLLGNLVALSEKQNKSVKDQPWLKKSKRFKGSNFKSTQAVSETIKWTANAIRARNMQFIEWAIKNWPSLEALKDSV